MSPPSSLFSWLAYPCLGLALVASALAQSPAPPSLQPNPALALTVITEMTAEGRQAAPPAPERPVYYVTDSAGPRQVGDVIPEQSPAAADMAALLAQSLAGRNYLPAQAPAHPPSLLIVYTWGAHGRIDHLDGSGIGTGTSPDDQMAVLKNLLERATLVGGNQFAVDLYHALQQLSDLKHAQPAPGTGGANVAQDAAALNPASPVEIFRNKSALNAALMAQAADDIYFVVASAYDYASALQHKSLLLWRTRMTVDASGGISEESSLPTLVLAAGPYFGRDMTQAAFLRRPSVGRGLVGSPGAIGTSPAPAAPPAK